MDKLGLSLGQGLGLELWFQGSIRVRIEVKDMVRVTVNYG